MMQGLQDVSCMEDHVQTIPRPFEMGALDLAEVIECHFEPRVRQTVLNESTSSVTTHDSGFTRIRSVSDSQNLYSSFRRTHTHTHTHLSRSSATSLALRRMTPVSLSAVPLRCSSNRRGTQRSRGARCTAIGWSRVVQWSAWPSSKPMQPTEVRSVA